MARKRTRALQMDDLSSDDKSYHDISSDEMEPEERMPHKGDSTSTTSRKKWRGPLKANKDWGKEKLILDWNFNQPIGENAKILAAHLGSYAKDGELLPLTVTSWHGRDKNVIDSIWQDVLENTNAPLHYKKICINTIAERWRHYKHHLKKNYYLTHETDEERLKNPPPDVKPEHWKTLVKFWGKKSTQYIAEINKQSMAAYRKGGTNLANLRYEETNESTNRVSVWRKSRMKKDGTFDKEDGAKEIEAQLSTKIVALASEESQDENAINKIFVDVIGEDNRHDRVRRMGIGVNQSSRKSNSNKDYDIDIQKLITEHKEQKEELNFLREKVMKQEERMIEQHQMIADMMKMLQNGINDTRNSEHTVLSNVEENVET